MRYKAEHKEETHRRIVETASREFREHGFEGVGIAGLMKKLDLTHGGFYAHFEDKHTLEIEALAQAFEEADALLEATFVQCGAAGIINLYLSPGHVVSAGMGCPVPSLAPEIGRQSGSLNDKFTERLKHRIEMLSTGLPGETETERLGLATEMFSSMVGAVTMARAVSDPELGERILEATRKRLLAML